MVWKSLTTAASRFVFETVLEAHFLLTTGANHLSSGPKNHLSHLSNPPFSSMMLYFFFHFNTSIYRGFPIKTTAKMTINPSWSSCKPTSLTMVFLSCTVDFPIKPIISFRDFSAGFVFLGHRVTEGNWDPCTIAHGQQFLASFHRTSGLAAKEPQRPPFKLAQKWNSE